MSKRNMLGSAPSINEVRGVVADLMEKLGNREGRKWLEKQKHLLRGELGSTPPQKEEAEPIPDWEVWQSVTVGGGNPGIRRILWKMRNQCTVEKDARKMLFSNVFAAQMYGDVSHTEIDLVKVTPPDLGIVIDPAYSHRGAPLADVVRAAHKRGLCLCPTDVVLRLRLNRISRGDSFLIMTTPLPLGKFYGLFFIQHIQDVDRRNCPYPILRAKQIICPYSDTVADYRAPHLIFWRPSSKTEKPEESGGGYEI